MRIQDFLKAVNSNFYIFHAVVTTTWYELNHDTGGTINNTANVPQARLRLLPNSDIITGVQPHELGSIRNWRKIEETATTNDIEVLD